MKQICIYTTLARAGEIMIDFEGGLCQELSVSHQHFVLGFDSRTTKIEFVFADRAEAPVPIATPSQKEVCHCHTKSGCITTTGNDTIHSPVTR